MRNQLLALSLLLIVISTGLFSLIIYPYFVLPESDTVFLATKPLLEEMIDRFGEPAETISEGQRFQVTGWNPTPASPALNSAVSFVRRYGSKIYIFLDEDDRAVQYISSNS